MYYVCMCEDSNPCTMDIGYKITSYKILLFPHIIVWLLFVSLNNKKRSLLQRSISLQLLVAKHCNKLCGNRVLQQNFVTGIYCNKLFVAIVTTRSTEITISSKKLAEAHNRNRNSKVTNFHYFKRIHLYNVIYKATQRVVHLSLILYKGQSTN